MRAGLEILQTLDVERDRGALGGREQALLEHHRNLGHRGVLELVKARAQQVVHHLRGRLHPDAEEPLEDQHEVRQLTFLVDLAVVAEEVVAVVHGVGEGVL